jgi:type II secretory ATPase GspE/PulE/Tfp pilus assembly ATPase PilB-like protein
VPGIEQIQILRTGELSEQEMWRLYLRGIVRMDPDFILMGEIRDAETAAMAGEQAVTGHKALTTMHASNVVEAARRIMNMMNNLDQRVMVINTISHIFGQRLIPEICQACGITQPISDNEKNTAQTFLNNEGLADEVQIPDHAITQNPDGCDECKKLGRIGVLPVHEVLVLNATAKKLVLSGTQADLIALSKLRKETIEAATMRYVASSQTPLNSLYAG